MTFGRNIQNTVEWSLYASVFPVGLLFMNFSYWKPDAGNNVNFDAISLSSKRTNFDEVQFFKHKPKLIICGTHNLQTFKHNTLINKLRHR